MNPLIKPAIEFWSKKIKEDFGKSNPPILIARKDQGMTKVIIRYSFKSEGAFCFIDQDGNIFKPIGWAKSGKSIKGNIKDPDFSFGKSICTYGVI